MTAFEKIAETNEVPDGGRTSVLVDETPALLLHIGDAYYCIEDTCTHDGAPMTDGELDGTEIICPRHGARFDVKTGQVLCMPAIEPIATFEVELRADGIYARPRE
ncbi:MAG: Rieske (2Fe-2S) protein [Planctomycetaceae bacterium]